MLTEYAALSDRLDTVAYSLEKEHVLLALTFEIDERNGVLLCDPGYHVGRVITVMCDGVYPHTGERKFGKCSNCGCLLIHLQVDLFKKTIRTRKKNINISSRPPVTSLWNGTAEQFAITSCKRIMLA